MKAAIAAGIPVVGFNAGFNDWQALGIKEFFGQDETIAGGEAGKRLGRRGCQEDALRHPRTGQRLPGNPMRRRQGRPRRREVENLYVNGNDMTAVAATITAKLQQDPSIDHIATLYSAIGMAALQAKESTGSNATIVTFDTDAQLVGAIKDKKIALDRRSATLPAGLSGRGLPVAVPQQSQHHRRRGEPLSPGRRSSTNPISRRSRSTRNAATR